MSLTYRKRMYAAYASKMQQRTEPISVEAADRWGRAFDWLLRGWMPPRPDAAVLDVGCGNGRLLRYFAKNGFTNVKGIDVSEEQVNLARHLHPDVEVADGLEYLKGHPGSIDYILAFDVIEHLTKDELLEFLDACHAALRPNGYLVVHTPNGDTPYGIVFRYGDFTHECQLNANALRSVFEVCGFEGIEAREMAPVPYSLFGAIRAVMWQAIRLNMKVRNLVETGNAGSGVFTRGMLARARRSETTS